MNLNIESCDFCKNTDFNYVCEQNNIYVTLNAHLCVFEKDLKFYSKACCIYSIYLGDINNENVKQIIINNVKFKSPKYISLNNEVFKVFNLSIKDKEIIKNTKYAENIIIQRNIQKIIYNDTYKFITKREYDHFLNEKYNNIDMMEIDDMDIIDETSNTSLDKYEYIYLLQDRSAVLSKKPIYKIGRTSANNFDRFKGYPKGFKILLHIVCQNSIKVEKHIIDLFKEKYIHITDFGNEYFEGNYKDMIVDIINMVNL